MSLSTEPTISALQALSATVGDAVLVQGYASPGDGGDGTFVLEASTTAFTIASATPMTATVAAATSTTPIEVTTTAAHGFVTGQSVAISGITGLPEANGAWLITAVNSTKFTLDGSVGVGTYTSGGTVGSVAITTTTGHGLWAGQQAQIAQAPWTGGSGINGTWHPLGISAATTNGLYLPIETSGSGGVGGLLGDGGMTIPSAVVGGRWRRLSDGTRNVRWFGTGNGGYWDREFAATIASVGPSDGITKSPQTRVFVPPDSYSFARTFVVNREVYLLGATGAGFFGTSELVFDAGVDGITLAAVDLGVLENGRADFSIIENLSVRAASQAGVAHGIVVRVRATLRDLYVTNFAGDGVNIVASNPTANANLFVLSRIRVDHCGGNGVTIDGADCNAGTIQQCDFSVNGGFGAYENSFLGNLYVMCHFQGNRRGSVFCNKGASTNVWLNCYAEGDQPSAYVDSLGSTVVGGFMYVANNSLVTTLDGVSGTRPVRVRNEFAATTSPVTPPAATGGVNPPPISTLGLPTGAYAVVLEIMASGVPGAGTFRASTDGGLTFGATITIPSSPQEYLLPTTGVTVGFGDGTYVAGDLYSFATTGPGMFVESGLGRVGQNTQSVLYWKADEDQGDHNVQYSKTWPGVWEIGKYAQLASTDLLLSGGRSLPFGGAFTFTSALRVGTPAAYNQIRFGAAAPGADIWALGDVQFNNGGASPNGWRCTAPGGWAPGGATWQASHYYNVGDVIDVGGDIYVLKSISSDAPASSALSGTSAPTWPSPLTPWVSDVVDNTGLSPTDPVGTWLYVGASPPTFATF